MLKDCNKSKKEPENFILPTIKIIAFIPGKIDTWYSDVSKSYCNKIVYYNNIMGIEFVKQLNNIQKNLKKNKMEILGITHQDDDKKKYKNINIKWIDQIDYYLLMR